MASSWCRMASSSGRHQFRRFASCTDWGTYSSARRQGKRSIPCNIRRKSGHSLMILEGSRRAAARVNQPAAEARGPLPPLYSAATLARRRPGPLGHVRGGRGPWTHHWRIMGEFMCVNADARVLLGPHILTAGAPARRRTACKPNHFPIIIRGDAARSASNACRARRHTSSRAASSRRERADTHVLSTLMSGRSRNKI